MEQKTINDAKEVVNLLTEIKNKEVEINYFKEKSEIFYTKTIKETYLKLTGDSKENLKLAVFLGAKLKIAKDNFLLPENKQDRKNLGLKMSVKYFIEQNFSLSETYVNRLIKASELAKADKDDKDNKILGKYLEVGHIGKYINVDNFIAWCKPKTDKAPETEVTETEVTETEEATETQQTQQKFGGVTITLTKESKQDIEQAIEYLMGLMK